MPMRDNNLFNVSSGGGEAGRVVNRSHVQTVSSVKKNARQTTWRLHESVSTIDG